jgi:hypothetical protein
LPVAVDCNASEAAQPESHRSDAAMPRHDWILTDVDCGIHHSSLLLSAADVPGSPAGWSMCKTTLQGGLRQGVEAVDLANGLLRVRVLPTRGMGLWKAWLGDMELGWQAPLRGPVHPALVPLDEASGVGWLSGFDELLCRCGLEWNGAPEFHADGRVKHTLHGRIANLPAHRLHFSVDTDARSLGLCGEVDEGRLFGPRLRLTSTVTTVVDSPTLLIEDCVANLSSRPSDLQLLYHINLGRPLVTPGARLFAPLRRLIPKDEHSARDLATWQEYPAEQAGCQETVLFLELAADGRGRTSVLLQAADERHGLLLTFQRQQFPYFIVWKCPQPAADGYVTGLEPAINLPHGKTFEAQQGRVARLAPGARREFRLELTALASSAALAQAREQIAELGRGVTPELCDRPQPGWSPGV